MITCPTLGQFGRLGNQLWQIAAAYSHAKRHGTDCVLPLWEYASQFPRLEASGVRFVRHLEPAGFWSEPSWNFTRLPPYWPNMGLHGYFQSPRYWVDKEEIRQLFQPLPSVEVPSDVCVVHVRRGDYLRLPEHHVVQSDEWVQSAVERIGASRVTVVSDDPVWCARRWPEWEVSSSSEVWDLSSMVNAQMLVTSSSSFSWWGAFLGGPERKIIAPKRWFGPALADHDVSQLDPGDGWEWL